MSFDHLEFRHCMGQFATGVAVATTFYQEHCGVTINSFASVSLEPPLVLFCLDKKAFCYDTFMKAEYFALSFLDASQKKLSQLFAVSGKKSWDNVDSVTHSSYGMKVLNGGLASMVCRTYALHDAGDHTVIVGEVIELDIKHSDREPLLYFRGEYEQLQK